MNNYYRQAARASKIIKDHPGLKQLSEMVAESTKVLDVGCGEGTRLDTLIPVNRNGWGVDINPKAVLYAKKNYPRHTFSVSDAAALPFVDNTFDLVYTAFALEHVTDPERVIAEMLRVCRSGGRIVILCPNYGAPNRRSPVSRQNPFIKLFKGIYFDLFPGSGLNWDRVIPAQKYTHPDTDTTVEPYLHSLILYLKSLPVKVINYSSVWETETKSRNLRKLIIKSLGVWEIFPFKYWGPQIFIVVQKL